jgi:DNA-binding HxlR family transcriptional regulator
MRQQLRGPAARIKGLLSRHVYSEKKNWKTALSLTEKGQKAACQMKSTMDKKRKNCLLLFRVMMQMGEDEDDGDD